MRTLLLGALIALFGGCGGATSPAPKDAPHGGDRVVIAALGDSITAGNPGYDPNPAVRARTGFGDDPRSQYEYWAERSHPGLEFRNCGVFGERTIEIAARLRECAAGADALVVQGGINDIAQGLGGGRETRAASVVAAAQNLDEIVAEGRKMGLRVAIADVLPWNNGHPVADPLIAALNREIAAIGHRRRVPVLPFHDTLEDPRHPGLMARRWTADGNHPSVAGYRRLGELAFRLP